MWSRVRRTSTARTSRNRCAVPARPPRVPPAGPYRGTRSPLRGHQLRVPRGCSGRATAHGTRDGSAEGETAQRRGSPASTEGLDSHPSSSAPWGGWQRTERGRPDRFQRGPARLRTLFVRRPTEPCKAGKGPTCPRVEQGVQRAESRARRRAGHSASARVSSRPGSPPDLVYRRAAPVSRVCEGAVPGHAGTGPGTGAGRVRGRGRPGGSGPRPDTV